MFTPDKLIIDGTEHQIESRHKTHGFRRYYQITIDHHPILLPLRLFYLIGSLAMLRDVGRGASADKDEDRGFVHRDRLRLSKSVMNQYVYCTRNDIHNQLKQANSHGTMSTDDFRKLHDWPVFEKRCSCGKTSHCGCGRPCLWRCAVDSAAITVGPLTLGFDDSEFLFTATGYFRRHPLPAQDYQPR